MLSSRMWLVVTAWSTMGFEYTIIVVECSLWKIWCGVMNLGVVSMWIVLKIRALDEIT